MENILLTVHLLVALSLIIVVLLQRSEGGGLGIGGGGGGVMTGRSAATALAKLTWILGAGFVISSIALTILAARDSASESVIDRPGIEAPADGVPGEPTRPGEELLPPVPSDSPATPPPVE